MPLKSLEGSCRYGSGSTSPTWVDVRAGQWDRRGEAFALNGVRVCCACR